MNRIEQVQRAVGSHVTVSRVIGTGGFAEVYEGNDERLGRRVAIKVLREDVAAPRARDRFLREARAAAQVRHPNVLAVFDVGEDAAISWFTMPLVVGESLSARLQRERRIDPDEVVRILSAAAAGLHAAHRAGLVHRDVKPDNIMLDGPERHVLIADFGVAAALVPDGDRITIEGAVIGTPRYMSPEQAAGEPVIDVRSDVYSLGVVGYEMLAGEPPFTAPNAGALLAKHLTAPVPPLRARAPHCPSLLITTIERSLEKDPADRWPTADALRQALEGRASSRVSAAAVAQSGDMSRFAPSGIGLVAFAFLAAAGVLAIDVSRGRILASPFALIVVLLTTGLVLGARHVARAQRPRSEQHEGLARRLRRARALRTATRAVLASMPKAERARMGSVELVADQLLFAAEQATTTGDSVAVEHVAAELSELHAAIEGTTSGDPAEAMVRVREIVARNTRSRAGVAGAPPPPTTR